MKRFGSKNSQDQLTCDTNFCAANTEQVSKEKDGVTYTVRPKSELVQKAVVKPRSQAATRHMASMKNQAKGIQEASKIRLIILLQKFQELGLEYRLLNQYFEKCLSNTTRSVDSTVIEAALVFDKDTLKDSASCYISSISAIEKTRTTNFSTVSEMVDGLSHILRDLK